MKELLAEIQDKKQLVQSLNPNTDHSNDCQCI